MLPQITTPTDEFELLAQLLLLTLYARTSQSNVHIIQAQLEKMSGMSSFERSAVQEVVYLPRGSRVEKAAVPWPLCLHLFLVFYRREQI